MIVWIIIFIIMSDIVNHYVYKLWYLFVLYFGVIQLLGPISFISGLLIEIINPGRRLLVWLIDWSIDWFDWLISHFWLLTNWKKYSKSCKYSSITSHFFIPRISIISLIYHQLNPTILNIHLILTAFASTELITEYRLNSSPQN